MSKKVKKDIQSKIDKLTEQLDSMEVTDENYDKIVGAIAELMEIRDKSKESKARAGKDFGEKAGSFIKAFSALGMLGLGFFTTKKAWEMDKSDQLVKNKNCLNLSNKFFRT